MYVMDDIKYIAKIEYDIYNINNYNYSHEKLVNMISDMIDNYNLIINLKKKQKELAFLVGDIDI